MAWQVEYLTAHNIVKATYIGHVSADDFKQGVTRTIEVARENKTLLLMIDDSKLEAAVSTPEIYEMPSFYEEIKGSRRTRIAVILPAGGQILEDVKFYVTVCRNRGWLVEAFTNEQEAIDWLRYTAAAPKPVTEQA
ncbi:MAG: hypothetical protein QNJ01_07575 [Desulfobacterales bacterium]|nr:hypothetical protein [Desulfobacterales bacterium]